MTHSGAGLLRLLKLVLLILAGCFFMAFGIHLLIAAYSLKDPFNFVMTFFASNLIILISAALLAGFIVRIFKPRQKADSDEK